MIRRVRALLVKELLELLGNRVTLVTLAVAPLMLTTLSLVNLYVTVSLPKNVSRSPTEGLPEFMVAACGELGELDCLVAYLGSIYQLGFLLLPMVIPSAIAAHAVVGEKTARTLEPLLATPLRTVELLGTKILAALLPGLAVTWLSWAVFLCGAWWLTPPAVFAVLVAPHWLLAIFCFAPMLGVASIGATVVVSSRVSDPRTAQQLSGLLILPMIALMLGQVLGAILVSPALVALASAIVFAIDVGVVGLAVATFERERVLTRWT